MPGFPESGTLLCQGERTRVPWVEAEIGSKVKGAKELQGMCGESSTEALDLIV